MRRYYEDLKERLPLNGTSTLKLKATKELTVNNVKTSAYCRVQGTHAEIVIAAWYSTSKMYLVNLIAHEYKHALQQLNEGHKWKTSTENTSVGYLTAQHEMAAIKFGKEEAYQWEKAQKGRKT